MGIEKAGLKLGKEIIAWTRTSGKSLLASKPLKVNTAGLKLAPQLEGDVVQFVRNDYLANIKKLALDKRDAEWLEELLTNPRRLSPEQTLKLRERFNRVTNRSDIDLNEVKKLFTGKEVEDFGIYYETAIQSHKHLNAILTRLESTLQPKDLEIIKQCDEKALTIFMQRNALGEYILSNKQIKQLSNMLEKNNLYISNRYSDKLDRRIIECFGEKNKTCFTFDSEEKILNFIEETGAHKTITLRNLNGNEVVVRVKPNDERFGELLRQTVCLEDSSGKLSEVIKYEKSDIDGIFNVVTKDLKTGKTLPLSKVTVDSNGKKIATQNLISSNGTKSHIVFEEMPNGNTQYRYKIVDKSGNTLLEHVRTRTVVNDSEFLHTINDKTYNVKFLGSDKIEVLNMETKQIDVVNLKTLLANLTGEEKAEILVMLKKVPADELLALNKHKVYRILKGEVDTSAIIFNSGYISSTSNPFVFLHELGHQKDTAKNLLSKNEQKIVEKMHQELVKPRSLEEHSRYIDELTNNSEFQDKEWKKIGERFDVMKKIENMSNKTIISSNSDLLKIYNREKSAYINKFGTDDARIDYFIKQGSGLGAEGEAIAEINALLSTPKSEPLLGTRSYLLAENFPETIAYASKLLG